MKPLVGLLLVAALSAVPAGNGRAAGRGGSPICTRGLVSVERDPRGLLPLIGANVSRPSAAAALRYMRPTEKPKVTAVRRASLDRQRGPEAKYECGTRVWQRTMVVYITARAFLPSASLSERVFFVGRFGDGYHVWQIVH